MSILDHAIFRINGHVYDIAGDAYASLDEAMSEIEVHYPNSFFGKNDAFDRSFREQPLSLATYGPAYDGWKTRVVRVRKPDKTTWWHSRPTKSWSATSRPSRERIRRVNRSAETMVRTRRILPQFS
jgi:hypothetical protein